MSGLGTLFYGWVCELEFSVCYWFGFWIISWAGTELLGVTIVG